MNNPELFVDLSCHGIVDVQVDNNGNIYFHLACLKSDIDCMKVYEKKQPIAQSFIKEVAHTEKIAA